MVAEVVLSVMGNRSDRRFPNLSCPWALEAVWLTRRRRADFHQGQERTMKLLKQAEYMAATGFNLIRQTTFARAWVHIRHSRQNRFLAGPWKILWPQNQAQIRICKTPGVNASLIPGLTMEIPG